MSYADADISMSQESLNQSLDGAVTKKKNMISPMQMDQTDKIPPEQTNKIVLTDGLSQTRATSGNDKLKKDNPNAKGNAAQVNK